MTTPALVTEPPPTPAPPSHESLVERYASMAHAYESPRVDRVLRAFDVALAAIGILLFAPLLLLCAAAVRATGSPILYRGLRVGRAGTLFTMYKFRTLEADAEARIGAYYGHELTERTSAEQTRIGSLLRAAKLDELPQLWNVLRGDMSIVGPRPIRPKFFEGLCVEIPQYWQRLVVRPGLTGFAQVRRGYETSMAEKLAHDLEWIADRSVGLYLRTLGATGWRVLRQSLRGVLRPQE